MTTEVYSNPFSQSKGEKVRNKILDQITSDSDGFDRVVLIVDLIYSLRERFRYIKGFNEDSYFIKSLSKISGNIPEEGYLLRLMPIAQAICVDAKTSDRVALLLTYWDSNAGWNYITNYIDKHTKARHSVTRTLSSLSYDDVYELTKHIWGCHICLY